MKPWLYKINFTFADENNPCYSKRDCYKEATGKCLLEEKDSKQKEGSVEVYHACLGLKNYLENFPSPYNALPLISSNDGQHGKHVKLCVAIREKIKIYVKEEIPRSKIKEIEVENETELHIYD